MTEFENIEEVGGDIKKWLDSNDSKISVSLLYAFNGSGKTRLSRLFVDNSDINTVLRYNALTEDSFVWDNENYILKCTDSSIISLIIDISFTL